MTENTLKKIYNITQACVTAIKHSLILIILIIAIIEGIILFPLSDKASFSDKIPMINEL